jgi:hypothetical protein
VGKGGIFAWNVNGNEASVELKKYNFDITRAEFKAEGATIKYDAVLAEPVEGVFEYRSKKRNTTADTGFPRFASFTNDAKIKNLGENIGYRGGFTLVGSKIMSAALDNSFSFISVKLNGERKFKSFSRSYVLGDTLLTADRAGLTIYQNQDSITHPGMGFKFSKPRNQLKMIRNNNDALKYSPFQDSYHKMEIMSDLLVWNLADPKINFSILVAKDQVSAQIESMDYFSDTRYQQLKGISSFHPLQMIVGYAQKKGTDKFYAMDVARENKIKEPTLKKAMASLAQEGYIDFNTTTGYITLKPKAKHYVNSHRDKKDFDHITIKSRAPSGRNATLNMENKELLLRGVRQFAFSTDSGAIIVRPDSGIVRVRKNRDMEFSGRVVTPNFVFKGSGFNFSYNDFWIDMPRIDSLIFRTKKPKKDKAKQEKVEINGQQLAATDKTVGDKAEKAKKDEQAQVDAPEDFPEDDSVRLQKIKALKLEKKLAKQKAKEEKKKAKALAKAQKAKKKKPQLDEFGDPIIEEDPVVAQEAAQPAVQKKKAPVSTEKALTGLNGKLYLNKPNNKSGRKKIPGYPMFDASTGAVVYFNKPDVLGGAYDSSVYFTIPPFKLDSIGSTSQSAVNFKGTFHSGDIFPPIETRLTVMPDQSLGFEYKSPEGGFPAYGNKGGFKGTILLNGNGLQGNGSINYLTSTLKSDTFTFYLDSVTTTRGISGAIAASKDPENIFPAANIGHFSMNWKVKQDSLVLNKPDTLFNKETMDPIKLYDGKFTYVGQTVITPNGLLGHGTIESAESMVKSPHFKFQKALFKANNAVFAIKSDNPDKPALLATDVFMDYDFKRGSANFAPEKAGFASTELPHSQFKTSLSGGNWDFKKKIVTMKEQEGSDISKSYFYSTRADQDSSSILKFNATSGYYDLNTYTLKAGGVPYIRSNDAHIFPTDGNVEITGDADLKVLQNSQIAMDTLNKFHKLANGEIDILSGKDFQGFADLQYTNSMGQTFPIKMGNFTRDSVIVEKGEPPVFITKAVGNIPDTQKFFIMPKILYRGDVHMTSNKQLLDFDGEMKLAFGDEASADWFPYKNTVNPDSVRITVKDMKTADGEPLVTGLHISSGSSKVYSTFVSKKADETDLSLFTVDGVLSYDKMNREFKLGDAQKAYADSYQGNVMLYNDSASIAKYEGSFNLIKPDKDFKLKAAGDAVANLDSGTVRFDSFLAFNINLPSSAWAQMGSLIADNTSGAPEAIDNSSALLFKLGEFIGNKGVQDYVNKTSVNSIPFTKVSPKLIHSLVFNEVKLKWSPKNSAWYSVGPLSLANIDKKDINARIGGHIEIKRIGEEDVISIYLEANPTTWYYLNYSEKALTVASSDGKFNQMLASKLKPAGTVATSFTPVAGEWTDRNNFVKNFRDSYLGGKGEPLVDAPAVQINDEPPMEEGEEGATASKKKKKKKGTATDEDGMMGEGDTIADDGSGALAGDEPPVKKKKKGKAKATEEGDFGADAPADTPAEEPAEKPAKKKKEKTVEAPVDAPMEDPATEEAPAKKKKKEKAVEPAADVDTGGGDIPAEEEAPVKKKKEKKPKKGEEEADVDMAP